MQLGHAGAEVSVSFSGNRIEYSQLEYDGGNNAQESSTSMGGAVTPALDSIAEFRVSTSNYGADVGQHAGALVEVVTKGGTKDFHGTAYESVRNQTLDANDWFSNAAGATTKTPLQWNIYGYSVGGPFVIPKHYNTSKSKTFFFWSQEWAKYRAASLITGDVPTARMRAGDFSECDGGRGADGKDVLGLGTAAIGPIRGASANANGNLISGGCKMPTPDGGLTVLSQVPIDPNAQAMMDAYVPLANNGVQHYASALKAPTNFSDTIIRVDQNISDKAQLFVRFSSDTWVKTTVPALWSGSSFDTTASAYSVPARQTVVHLNYNFRPNLLNEAIVSYTDTPHTISTLPGPGSPNHSNVKPSDWNAATIFPANANVKLLPSLSVAGGLGFGSFGINQGNYRGPYDAEPVYTYRDNIAWTKGKHTFKFGLFLEKFQLTEQFGSPVQGVYNFDGSTTYHDSTGNGLADMYLGQINNYYEGTFNNHGVYTGGYGVGHWRRTDFEPYFQDDWKVTRRLTINMGLRYYMLIAPHDVTKPTVDSSFFPGLFNPMAQAPLNADGLLQPNPATGQTHDFTSFGNGLQECGANGIPKGCQRTYYENIGPRLGFAWDPTGSGKTSVRGAVGIYYEPGNGNDANVIGLEGNAPTTLAPQLNYLTSYKLTVASGGGAGLLGPSGIQAIPYNQKNPAITQMNLDVQHEFRGGNLVTVAYVGNLGRHLDTARNQNQIPIGSTTMNIPEFAAGAGAGQNAICDNAGNCNVQQSLIHGANTNFFAPYQGYTSIVTKQFTALSNYNSLQANFRHTVGHGLTLQAAYTWSHMIDTSTSGYFETSVDDNYQLDRWRGTSDLNRSQVIEMNYIYDLPFFKHSQYAVARQALGGWRVSGITSFFTGTPQDFGCGVSGYASGIGGGVRCNGTGPLKIQKSTYVDSNPLTADPTIGPRLQWFNGSTFAQPTQDQLLANGQPGMFGYQGRNPITGPGRNNFDLALYKEIALPWFRGEHSTIQFRLETFNTFNHPQWKYVNAGCNGDDASAFGRTCGGDQFNAYNGVVNSAWAPRQMQLGMKFLF